MNQNIKNEEFSVALFSIKAFITLSLVFLLLIALLFTVVWYLRLTGMYPMISFAGCVIFIWSILSSKIYSKKLHFSSSHLIVKNINDNIIHEEMKIESYNSYFFVLKKIGFIIRFYDGNNNHFFFNTSKLFLKWEDNEEKNLNSLISFLKNNYHLKNILIDKLIFAVTYVIYSFIHNFNYLFKSKNCIFYQILNKKTMGVSYIPQIKVFAVCTFQLNSSKTIFILKK